MSKKTQHKVVAEQILAKNISAIMQHSPGIAKWIESADEPNWVEDIKSENGENNLLIKDNGQVKAAYSLKNPTEEAQTITKNYKFGNDDISILIGSGLGYMTQSIIKQCDKNHRIVVVEPSGAMVRRMLSQYNFAKYLEKQLILIAGPGKVEVSFIISVVESIITTADWIVIAEAYTRMRPLEYGEITLYTNEVINQIRCNTGTVAGSGGKMADNDIACLPYVIRHRGVKEIEGLFKGLPAVLVSTGPSLAKNIHILQQYQNHVIIIAVGQALRPLLSYDIRPDFACTVDFGKVNYGHFKGILDTDIPLIATSRTYAPLLQNYQGPMFVVATPNANNSATAANILIDKGFCDAGGSVAHLCLGVARLLKCSPIIMVGQDLSIGETSHFEQADESGRIEIKEGMIIWHVTDTRSTLKGPDYIMGPAVTVPGYYGKPVVTNVGLASFLTSFEGMIANIPPEIQVINATQGGVFIKGANHIHLEDAIKLYCKEKINNEKTKRIIPFLSYADNADDLISKAIPLLEKDIRNLKETNKAAKTGIKTDNGILKLLHSSEKDKKSKLVKLLAENEKASLRAQELSINNPLVSLAIFGASRRIQASELKAKASPEHLLRSHKDLKIRVKRNQIILEAAKLATKELTNTYTKSLTILKEYKETKEDHILRPREEEPIVLEDAWDLFAVGNFAKPLLEAQRALRKNPGDTKAASVLTKALEMRNKQIYNNKLNKKDDKKKAKELQYNNLINKSRKLGREEKKYEEAFLLIKEAVRLLPEREEAHWGLATVCHYLGKFEKAEKEFKILTRINPKNWRYLFELGQVQLRRGNVSCGLSTVRKAMSHTEEFDSFLAHIATILIHIGNYKEALSTIDTYLTKFPSDFISWTSRGDILNKLGRYQEADESLRKAISIKPDFKTAKSMLNCRGVIEKVF